MDIIRGFSILNILSFGIILVASILRYLKTKRFRHIVMAVLGLYWTGLYVYIGFTDLPIFLSIFSLTYIQPALASTGALMAFMTLVRLKED